MSTATETSAAKLIVAQGANRGGTYVLTGELTGIGQAAENQVVLADAELAPHHATIARRNNRYALFVPEGRSISIDGQPAPNEQWVWLPTTAMLRLSTTTTLKFVNGTETADAEPKPNASAKPERRSKPGKKEKSERTGSRKVAKFVTDRAGGTLVRLGEDGQLPELQLNELAGSTKVVQHKRRESNPAVLYAVLLFSLLASVAMLFLDFEGTFSIEGKASSRRVVVEEFLGDERQAPQPYQRLLREANLAYSRGDGASERDLYRRVLRMLNSEDRSPFSGVTGSLDDDERLRHHLGVLLGR